jgi:hypothetical protein
MIIGLINKYRFSINCNIKWNTLRGDGIGFISLNFEIIGYEIFLDFLYLSPEFRRDIASPYFTSI